MSVGVWVCGCACACVYPSPCTTFSLCAIMPVMRACLCVRTDGCCPCAAGLKHSPYMKVKVDSNIERMAEILDALVKHRSV